MRGRGNDIAAIRYRKWRHNGGLIAFAAALSCGSPIAGLAETSAAAVEALGFVSIWSPDCAQSLPAEEPRLSWEFRIGQDRKVTLRERSLSRTVFAIIERTELIIEDYGIDLVAAKRSDPNTLNFGRGTFPDHRSAEVNYKITFWGWSIPIFSYHDPSVNVFTHVLDQGGVEEHLVREGDRMRIIYARSGGWKVPSVTIVENGVYLQRDGPGYKPGDITPWFRKCESGFSP